MKYLFYFSIFSLLVFTLNKDNPEKLTQVILSVPNLSNEDISVHLKNEFDNLNDIDYIDGSLISNTIVLKVDEQTFNKSKVEKMLNRWGLEIEEYAFVSLAPSSINE